MKKINRSMLMLLVPLALVVAFEVPQQRTYRLELTDQQLGELAAVIDQSAAPHNLVMNVQKTLQNQLAAQFKSDSLPSGITDSTKAVKPSVKRK